MELILSILWRALQVFLVLWVLAYVWLVAIRKGRPIVRYDIEWARWFVRQFANEHARYGGCSLCPVGIFFTKEKGEVPSRHMRHEVFHWRHQLRWLIFPWYPAYWILYLRHGYEDHPWEIMAREAEEGDALSPPGFLRPRSSN